MSNIHITLNLDFSPHTLKKYFGFTEEEIDHLAAQKPKMIDFEKLHAQAKKKRRK